MERPLALVVLLAFACPGLALAQAARLTLPDFAGLADKATETVSISLDEDMLRNAGQFLGNQGGTPEETRALLDGLKGVYIRVFEFADAGRYSTRDLDAVHRQLQAAGSRWKQVIAVQSEGERVGMYLHDGNGRPEDGGLAIVVSEPTEFVIVNLVGKVDLARLRSLQGKLGVPSSLPMLGGSGEDDPPAAPKPPQPPVRGRPPGAGGAPGR
jgi:hypothetical protein